MPDYPLTDREIEALLGGEGEGAPASGLWEVIVKYGGDITPVEASLGITAELLGDSFAILTLPPGQIPRLYDFMEIEYVELPKDVSLTLRESMSQACITPVQSGRYHLRGQGVIVGTIDSGIDYTHPDFINENGESRVLFLWDQSGTGQPPPGFNRGVEYTGAQLTAALQSGQPYSVIPPMDSVGHGTAVAGIAAGNGRASGGLELGAAPEAGLVVVRLGEAGRGTSARTTDIMRALKYITDKAAALNMPVAVNLSFGTNNGSHGGGSLFEAYINSVAGQWKTVIVAATGNEGFAGHHFSGQLSTGQTIDASFAISGGQNSVYLALWKQFADTFDLELIAPGGQSTGILRPETPLTQTRLQGAPVVVHYGRPSFYNLGQEVFIQIRGDGAPIPQGVWRLLITGRQVVEGSFHIWLPTIDEVGADTAFLRPDPYTTLTLPATAEKVISVGGYNAAINAPADFSGRGGVVGIKPDLVAPAVGILAPMAGGGYDTFTGTSMAAPFVTGASALMMEWGIVRANDHYLYGQRVKAFLQRSASRLPGVAYPNPIWGYGALCLRAAMETLAEYNR
ncbi:MAG: S8 family serine peptidase [Oscillospiraceae bacterium]|nr:S8 family serine peptidase [Oscillospiraceae bacterium]